MLQEVRAPLQRIGVPSHPRARRSREAARREQQAWRPIVLRAWHPNVLVLLQAFLALQFLIPARLVIGGLGAVGRPSVAVGVLLIYLWVVSAVRQGQLPAARQPMRWLIAIYVVTTLVGYCVGYDRGLPAEEASSAQRWIIYIASMVGVTLAVADGIRNRRQLDTLLRSLVAFTAFMAFAGVLQYFRIVDITRYIRIPGLRQNSELLSVGARGDAGYARVAGTANHYIEFGVVLAIVLPLAIHYAIFAKRRRDRVMHVIFAALIASAIPFSISRSAIIAVAVSMVLMATVWVWRVRYNALAIVGAGMAAFQVFVPGLLGTIKSLFKNLDNDPSIQGRLDDIAFVHKMFEERPWLGRGPGTLLPSSYRLLDNQLYGTLIVGGIVGLVALLLMFAVPYFLSRSIRLRGADQETRHLGQALAVIFPAALVASGTFDSLAFSTFTGVLFMAIGAVGALWRISGVSVHWPLKEARPGDIWVTTPLFANVHERVWRAVRESETRVSLRWVFASPGLPAPSKMDDRAGARDDRARAREGPVHRRARHGSGGV